MGTVPTTNWNEQKAKVTGYTQPSDQYFATRTRLAYHPPDKRFGSFSGTALKVEGVSASGSRSAQAEKQTPPPPPPPAEAQQQSPPPPPDDRNRSQKLADYEADYLNRLEEQRQEAAKAMAEQAAAEAAEAASASGSGKRGALPKGFEPKPEPPKKSRGTLPKGF